MKRTLRSLPAVIFALLAPGLCLAPATGHAQKPAAEATPSPTPASRWMVRVEFLVVALPQDKALALLPDLRDEGKIEGAYTQIMSAIQHKQATLIGHPVVYANSGQKATSETVFEKLYPTQFQPPLEPQLNVGLPPQPSTPPSVSTVMPSNFEKRNVGVTLEVEPTVSNDGKWIEMNLLPQHVAFDAMDGYEFLGAPGVTYKIEQPRFYTNKESTTVTVRSGQRLLLGMHPSLQNDQVELHILQATATAVP